jgi:dual oxidase
MIGGGIGVTPFVSILKDYIHQLRTNDRLRVKKLYFIWVCRTQRQFEWVIDVLREVEEADEGGILEIHTFITALQENFDLRTSLMYICERQFHKINGCSLFTGLQAPTHFGRPRFDTVLRQILQRHNDEKVLAVYCCASPIMADGVAAAIKSVRATPRPNDPIINFSSLSF